MSRNLESNGPDVKIRGTAAHIAEKYMTLARDALSSGDVVAGESYLQHAEHYHRIIMANQAQAADDFNGSGAARLGANGADDPGSGEQPDMVVDGNRAGGGDDDGVARTIARSPRKSGNGAGASSKDADKDESPEDDASDEAIT